MQASAHKRGAGLQQPPVVRASSMPVGGDAAAAAATAVPPVSSLLPPSLASSGGLLYVEPHARDPSALLFCCLCRCSLTRDANTLLSHLEGKRHGDKSRAVHTIRATLTIRPHSSSNAPRRIDLGLLPCLNLPAFWKAALSALKWERDSGLESPHPLSSLNLDDRLVLPHVVKLMWLDPSSAQGTLHPLLFSQDFARALNALEELKQIHLVVTHWNSKVNAAKSMQQEQESAAALVPDADSTQPLEQPATRPMLRAPVRVSRSADATPIKGAAAASSSRLHSASTLPKAAPPRMRRSSSSASTETTDAERSLSSDSRSSDSDRSSSASSADSDSASPPSPLYQPLPQQTQGKRSLSSRKGPCSFFSPVASANRCTRLHCAWQHRAPTAEEIAQIALESAAQSSKPPLLAHPPHKSRSAAVTPMLKVKSVRGGQLTSQAPRVATPYHSPDPLKRAEQQACMAQRTASPAVVSPPTSESLSSEERDRSSADSSANSSTDGEAEMQSLLSRRGSSVSSDFTRSSSVVRSSFPTPDPPRSDGESEYLLEADGSPRCNSSASPTLPSALFISAPPSALAPPSLTFHPIAPADVSSPVARVLQPNATRSAAAHPPHTRAQLMQLQQRVQTTADQSRYSSLFQFDDEHDRGFVAAVAAAAAASYRSAQQQQQQQQQQAAASHSLHRSSSNSFSFGFPAVLQV